MICMDYSDEKNLYETARSNALDLLQATSDYLEKPFEKLTWQDVEKFELTFEDMELIKYPFSDKTSQVLSGFVKKERVHRMDCYIIGINESIKSKGRQHFTECHEFYHYNFQFRRGLASQFSDLINKDSYSSDELPIEMEANFGAAQLMLSSEALREAMSKQMTASDLMDFFGISRAAIWTIIRDELYYDCAFPYSRSCILASSYCNGEPERSSFVNVLISHIGLFKDLLYTADESGVPVGREDINNIYSYLGIELTNSHYYQFNNLLHDLYKPVF